MTSMVAPCQFLTVAGLHILLQFPMRKGVKDADDPDCALELLLLALTGCHK